MISTQRGAAALYILVFHYLEVVFKFDYSKFFFSHSY